jgi:hydrophobe/amphiphile efflux-1 (HAE1) family protein
MSLGGLNILNSTYNSNSSTLIGLLKPWEERKTSETSLRTILLTTMKEISTYPEAIGIVIIPPPIPGLGNAGGFQFELQDRSAKGLDNLAATANNFMAEAAKQPELSNLFSGFRTTVPQLDLDLNRDKTRNMNIPINSVFQSLQILLGGYPVNDFNLFDRTYKVMVQAEPEFRQSGESLRSIYVRSQTGDMIPLSTLCTLKEDAGPSLIQRYNMYPTAEIIGSASPAFSSGQALDAMESIAAKIMPQGYGFQWSGTAYQEKESGSTQGLIFGLAIIFVFLFLAAQYESWGVPFSILFGLPIGIFGAFLAVFVAHIINNVYTQIGLIMLIGLAAKNAILIVEFAKERYEQQGMTLDEAAVEGARVRFRPILMTSFAFIFGVVPLVIASGAGAASRHSLGTAVFGGMLAATGLGVFFIPLLYVLIQGMMDWKKKPGAAAPAETPAQVVKETPAPAALPKTSEGKVEEK